MNSPFHLLMKNMYWPSRLPATAYAVQISYSIFSVGYARAYGASLHPRLKSYVATRLKNAPHRLLRMHTSLSWLRCAALRLLPATAYAVQISYSIFSVAYARAYGASLHPRLKFYVATRLKNDNSAYIATRHGQYNSSILRRVERLQLNIVHHQRLAVLGGSVSEGQRR